MTQKISSLFSVRRMDGGFWVYAILIKGANVKSYCQSTKKNPGESSPGYLFYIQIINW